MNEMDLVRDVLESKGLLAPEMREPLPHMFMMEMLELNEHLVQLELQPTSRMVEKFEAKVGGYLERLISEIRPLLAHLQELGDGELRALQEFYYKQKYLLRIQERLLHLRPAIR